VSADAALDPRDVPPGPVTVSTEWLAERLARTDRAAEPGAVVVVDVRGKVLPPGSKPRYLGKRDEYEAGHIPGAVFVDWTRDIVDLSDPVPVQIAPADAFAAKMTELGIDDSTLVVAYDDYNHVFAGRLAWALRFYGHDAVRVLDGGFGRWLAEGRPTAKANAASAAPAALPVRFTPRPRPELRRSADEVAATLGKSDVLLIDARPAEQYAGAVSASVRSGHIPGARNVPYASLIDKETGRFLPLGELGRVFANAGVDVGALPRDIIVYCNGGVSCTVALSALRMLGRDEVAVYDGSWNEWGADAVRPIRTGPTP
jgi:thiosulfate/3-mercaptopyruvate sulfurtransferase